MLTAFTEFYDITTLIAVLTYEPKQTEQGDFLYRIWWHYYINCSLGFILKEFDFSEFDDITVLIVVLTSYWIHVSSSVIIWEKMHFLPCRNPKIH